MRVLQDKSLPIGSNESIKVDLRIIATTDVDLRKLVEEGKFRENLYYRLNIVNPNLPPCADARKTSLSSSSIFHRYSRENEKFLNVDGRSVLDFEPDAMQILMEHA